MSMRLYFYKKSNTLMPLYNINTKSFSFIWIPAIKLAIKYTTALIYTLSMQALFYWISHLLVILFKITRVSFSDLKYKNVWADKLKNVLPNKRSNLHYKKVKLIFIDGNNNKEIIEFKFVFLFFQLRLRLRSKKASAS